MRFFKLLRFDLLYGVMKAYHKYILLTGLFIPISIEFEFKRSGFTDITNDGVAAKTLGDIALYVFGGMKEYIPSPNDPFLFPAFWLLFYIIIFYTTLYYPFKDLNGFGKQIIVHGGSRKSWWLSKCLWNAVTVSVFFVAIWMAILLYARITGAGMTFQISPYMREIFELNEVVDSPEKWDVRTLLIVGPWLTAIALSLVQMVLSLLIKPIFSFIVSVIILIVSAYYYSPVMLGNYAMCVRSAQIMTNGMPLKGGIVYCVVVILSSVMIGMVIFRNYDILNRE